VDSGAGVKIAMSSLFPARTAHHFCIAAASNFAQTSALNKYKLQLRGALSPRAKMSKTDQFRQYAEEAMRWARQSRNEKEKQSYVDLASTWTQAAVQSEYIFGVTDRPPENKAQ
jgi:hypothetical protein